MGVDDSFFGPVFLGTLHEYIWVCGGISFVPLWQATGLSSPGSADLDRLKVENKRLRNKLGKMEAGELARQTTFAEAKWELILAKEESLRWRLDFLRPDSMVNFCFSFTLWLSGWKVGSRQRSKRRRLTRPLVAFDDPCGLESVL